jgi:hypothetical protein
MIINGDSVWFVPPTSRYGLSKVSSRHLTNNDFTFLCQIKVDWSKMIENSNTQEAAVMIKNGKHLGISVAKTGDNFRIVKGAVWVETETPEEKGIHQIIIPLNDVMNSPDISHEYINLVFSYDIINKKLQLIVNDRKKIIDVPNELIDYTSSWLWIACANPLESSSIEHRHHFFGEYKLIGIYQKYLSDNEIKDAFDKIITPEHKAIAYYDFKETTPYKILDITQNGNNLNKYDKEWMDSH